MIFCATKYPSALGPPLLIFSYAKSQVDAVKRDQVWIQIILDLNLNSDLLYLAM